MPRTVKEKKVKTRTIWVPLDSNTAAKLVNEATSEKRAIGAQAAIIIEKYFDAKEGHTVVVPA